MTQLYVVGNPIDRQERANLNLTFSDIQRRFSIIQRDLGVLAGNQEVQELINTINQAITNANQSTMNSNDAIARLDAQLLVLEERITDVNNLRNIGDWNETTEYKKNNIVNYNKGSYIANSDNTNVTPGTGNTWGLISQQGEKGDTGAGLNILGVLTNESDLPSTANDGDAYYINGNLYIYSGNSFINVGSIKGDPGSDANVTKDNVETALGYTPANQTDVTNFESQYEFRTPTISGRQIRITKPHSSNRIPINLTTTLDEGDAISISVDGGATSVLLKDSSGNDVTALASGLLEVVRVGDFFTLRNRGGGISQSDLDALITVTNEAIANNSELRNQFITENNRISDTTLTNDSSWNDILISLQTVQFGAQKSVGRVTPESTQMAFISGSGSASNSAYVIIENIGFTPRTITLINELFTSVTFLSLELPQQGGYSIIRAGGSSFRLQSPAVFTSDRLVIPVPSISANYNYIIVG